MPGCGRRRARPAPRSRRPEGSRPVPRARAGRATHRRRPIVRGRDAHPRSMSRAPPTRGRRTPTLCTSRAIPAALRTTHEQRRRYRRPGQSRPRGQEQWRLRGRSVRRPGRLRRRTQAGPAPLDPPAVARPTASARSCATIMGGTICRTLRLAGRVPCRHRAPWPRHVRDASPMRACAAPARAARGVLQGQRGVPWAPVRTYGSPGERYAPNRRLMADNVLGMQPARNQGRRAGPPWGLAGGARGEARTAGRTWPCGPRRENRHRGRGPPTQSATTSDSSGTPA